MKQRQALRLSLPICSSLPCGRVAIGWVLQLEGYCAGGCALVSYQCGEEDQEVAPHRIHRYFRPGGHPFPNGLTYSVKLLNEFPLLHKNGRHKSCLPFFVLFILRYSFVSLLIYQGEEK